MVQSFTEKESVHPRLSLSFKPVHLKTGRKHRNALARLGFEPQASGLVVHHFPIQQLALYAATGLYLWLSNNQSAEGTVMAVVRLMKCFWKRLSNSFESATKSTKECETYSKAILYSR